MSKLNFRRSLAQLVLLAILVGLVPELLIGGLKDTIGPCGFDSTTCQTVYIQGCIQTLFAFLCTVAAILVAFVLSNEYSSGGDV